MFDSSDLLDEIIKTGTDMFWGMGWFGRSVVIVMILYFVGEVLDYYIGIFRIQYRWFIPKPLANFPEHETSLEDFEQVYEKVIAFRLALSQQQPASIYLSEKEINDLCLQGQNTDKLEPGRHAYFRVENNCIVEQLIEWPSFPGAGSCWLKITEIKFQNNNGKLMISDNKRLEECGFKKKEEHSWRLLSSDSNFINLVLGNRDNLYYLTNPGFHRMNPRSFDVLLHPQQSLEYRNIESLFALIKTVAIHNGILSIFSRE
jgi:hypothetical protein